MDVQSDGERETEEGGRGRRRYRWTERRKKQCVILQMVPTGGIHWCAMGTFQCHRTLYVYSNGNNKFYLTSIAYTHMTSLQFKTCD